MPEPTDPKSDDLDGKSESELTLTKTAEEIRSLRLKRAQDSEQKSPTSLSNLILLANVVLVAGNVILGFIGSKREAEQRKLETIIQSVKQTKADVHQLAADTISANFLSPDTKVDGPYATLDHFFDGYASAHPDESHKVAILTKALAQIHAAVPTLETPVSQVDPKLEFLLQTRWRTLDIGSGLRGICNPDSLKDLQDSWKKLQDIGNKDVTGSDDPDIELFYKAMNEVDDKLDAVISREIK